jgi:hypothetical protein
MKFLLLLSVCVLIVSGQLHQQPQEEFNFGEAAEHYYEQPSSVPSSSSISGKQLLPDTVSSPRTKLLNAISILTSPSWEDSIYIGAISDGLDAVFYGNVVFLPSRSSQSQAAVDVIYRKFNNTIRMMDKLIEALSVHMTLKFTSQSSRVNPNINVNVLPISSKAIALEVHESLLFTKEILQLLSYNTIRCNPNIDFSEQLDFCKTFLANTDSVNDIDTMLTDMNFRSIRSLFFLSSPSNMNKFQRSNLEALTWNTGVLSRGQCSAYVANALGLKAVMRSATVSFWNFPLLNVPELIGKKVWVFEWVPADILYTISLCHEYNESSGAENIVKDIDITVVHKREALFFWDWITILTSSGTTSVGPL